MRLSPQVTTHKAYESFNSCWSLQLYWHFVSFLITFTREIWTRTSHFSCIVHNIRFLGVFEPFRENLHTYTIVNCYGTVDVVSSVTPKRTRFQALTKNIKPVLLHLFLSLTTISLHTTYHSPPSPHRHVQRWIQYQFLARNIVFSISLWITLLSLPQVC